MLSYRLVLILILFFSFELLAHDKVFIKNKECYNDNAIIYFLGQKAYKKNNYVFSIYFFNNLIENNYPSNKYAQKSRVYDVLISLRLKKFMNAKITAKAVLLNKTSFHIKYIDYICYTSAIALYYYNTEDYLFMLNRYKNDITYYGKSLKYLYMITGLNKEKQELIDKIMFYIKAHDVYICEYYFKEGAYLSVIKRIGNFIYKPIDYYDNYKNYLLIKSYNELYLSPISDKYIEIFFDNSKFYRNKYKRPSIY